MRRINLRTRHRLAVAGVAAALASGIAVSALDASALTPTLPPLSGTNIPATQPGAVAQMVAGLRVMNYYPAQHGFDYMWMAWDPAAIDADMGRLTALGANTVRALIPPGLFGYPTPLAQYTRELSQFVNMASAHGLGIELTLAAYWAWYTDLSGSASWMKAILTPYANDPRITFVELFNEIDPMNAPAMAWAQQMLPLVRSDGGRPVTVSVMQWDSAAVLNKLKVALGTQQPDFYDYHFYGNAYLARATFQAAKQIAGGVPLFIGETGYSTWLAVTPELGVPLTLPSQEAYQDLFYRTVEQAARDEALPPAAPWTLNDFVPSTLAKGRELFFGLYHLDGTPKPAAATVKATFTGAALDRSLDWGFEGDGGGLPTLWELDGSGKGTFARDTLVSRTGAASARISQSTNAGDGTGPAFIAEPVTGAQPGEFHSLAVWVRGDHATGTTTLRIQWFNAGMNKISELSGTVPATALFGGQWAEYAAWGTAPAGTAYCRLVLSSIDNTGSVWFDDIAWA
jgi:hypothetical protein